MEYIKSCIAACCDQCMKIRRKKSTDSTRHIIIPVQRKNLSMDTIKSQTYTVLTQPAFEIPGDPYRRPSLSAIGRKSSAPPVLTSTQAVQPVTRRRSIMTPTLPVFRFESQETEEDGNNNFSASSEEASPQHTWSRSYSFPDYPEELPNISPSRSSLKHLTVDLHHSRRSSMSSFEITKEEVDSGLYCSSEQLYDPNAIGRLCFSVDYDRLAKQLRVLIICARNLVLNGSPALVDSCIKVGVSPKGKRNQKSTTQIQKMTSNPNYNETVVIDNIIEDCLEELNLRFTMYIYDKHSRRQIFGIAIYKLELPDLSEEDSPLKLWRNIVSHSECGQVEPRGSLLISLCYSPMDSLLRVNIIKATGLLLSKHNKPLEGVYVKLALVGRGQILQKEKTKIVIPAQTDPTFDKMFNLQVAGNVVDQCCVVISVCGKTTMGKRVHLGYTSIGPPFFANGCGLEHWTKIVSIPYTFVGKWHPLTEWKDGDSMKSIQGNCNMF